MNSNFISALFGLGVATKETDILSSVSDSIPIIYISTVTAPETTATTTTTITTYNARFFCLGNLLIQFNDSANTSIVSGPLPFPYAYDTTPYSVVSSNYSWPITFTKSNIVLSSVVATNFNFLSIGPRPALFYPVVPFLTTGSPQISVSITNSFIITFIFNKTGSIIFYRPGKITSYTAVGAGGDGGAGGAGGSNTPGGGGGGGGGGSITYSTYSVSCTKDSKITVNCGTSKANGYENFGNTDTFISPSNINYATAFVGTPGLLGLTNGGGGAGANYGSFYGLGGTTNNARGADGTDSTSPSIPSGGGGGGAWNGGNGGTGGYSNLTVKTGGSAGSGGGGAGGKNNNAGIGGAGGTVTSIYLGVGGKGGNSGPTVAGSNGNSGGGGGGGGAGGGESQTAPGGAGGKGGYGMVVFVIDFSS